MCSNLCNGCNSCGVCKINSCGIPVIRTTAVTTDTTNSAVIYDIDCRRFYSLPNEGLMLLYVSQAPATGSDAFLVSISARRTVSGTGTITSANIPLVNGSGTQMTSAEITQGNRYIIYYNKCQGIFQVVNYIPATAPAGTAAVATSTQEE